MLVNKENMSPSGKNIILEDWQPKEVLMKLPERRHYQKSNGYNH